MRSIENLNKVCNTQISHASSGFKNDDNISGRSYGGCAIFGRADIDTQVHFVATNNTRLYAFRVCQRFAPFQLLLINVYMPHESDGAAADEFHSIMADLLVNTDEI